MKYDPKVRASWPSSSAEYRRKWYAENRERVAERWKKHKVRLSKQNKRWWSANTERLRVWRRAYCRRRMSDPNLRLAHNLRCRMYRSIKRHSKVNASASLLGCSMDNLWLYLESKFEPGMTRENYGKVWQVDHIMPCAIFDLAKPEHQKRCFHFSNLQPLFSFENRSKNSKVETNQFNLL